MNSVSTLFIWYIIIIIFMNCLKEKKTFNFSFFFLQKDKSSGLSSESEIPDVSLEGDSSLTKSNYIPYNQLISFIQFVRQYKIEKNRYLHILVGLEMNYLKLYLLL